MTIERHEFKLNKIRSLKSEVNEFHPVLNDLLPKLPDVTHVDYTHGPNEMGADFVITKLDKTLMTSEYIGVIVKTGSISQDHGSIERQIDECAVGRKIEGGKKTIYLDQIWVVVNGPIKNNAKEKIHEKFKAKNIKFVWDELLVQLIDGHYPEYWEDVDRNIGIYLSSVKRQIGNLNSQQSLLDIGQDEFYVDQDIAKAEKVSKKKFIFRPKSSLTKLSAVLRTDRYVLIEAGMGYGKSRLLRQAAIEYCDHRNFAENGTLPVFISFRDLVDKFGASLERVLEHLKTIEKFDIAGNKLLFVIDSVDEVKGENQEKAETISHFISQLMPHEDGMRAIFASRPFQEPLAISVLDGCLSRYMLNPLSMQRLISFVEKLCLKEIVTTKLKADLQKSDLFKSLPKTPISAILLGRVLNAETNKELPSTLPELYSKYLELALGRWNSKKEPGSEKEYETTIILVRKLAKFMFNNDLSEMGIGDAKGIVTGYLEERETGQDANLIFEKIKNCSEIFAIDELKNKIFFRHRTFLEFIYAQDMHRQKGVDAKIEHPFAGYWGAVNYFYLGLLKDCPEQLQLIFDLPPGNELEKISKIGQAGSYLLAAYQSPYEAITSCVRKTFIEAAEMYCEICEKPEESKLGKFPEMHLLAIMTALMRHGFEYGFFEKALIDIETEVLLKQDIEKREMVAAFFIASVRAGLGNQDAFTSLIEGHQAGLTTVLKLGTQHVAKEANIANKALKLLGKRLERSRKANPRLALGLYQTPLTERQNLNKLV